jgi:hypothetical protein
MATTAEPDAPAEAAPAPAENQAPSAPSNTAARTPISTSPGAFSVHAMEDDDEGDGYMNILIYGKHGAGKTTLAGSSVDVREMKDVLVISAEGGKIVFRNNPRIKDWKGLDVIKIDRIEQFQKAYEWVREHVRWRDQEGPTAEGNLKKLQEAAGLPSDRVRRYHTVLVDSLSDVEQLNLVKILDLDKLGLDAGDDMEVAGWPQFRKNMHLMMTTIRKFRDLRINFVAICSEKFDKDERNQYHYTPRLTGQLATLVQGPFDIVGWLVPSQAADPTTGAAPRRLFVQPQTAPKADAKNRLSTFQQPFFDNPTMEDIMAETGYISRPLKKAA